MWQCIVHTSMLCIYIYIYDCKVISFVCVCVFAVRGCSSVFEVVFVFVVWCVVLLS